MKILIVDDHPLILSALSQLLPQLDRPVTVYGAADRDETYAMLAAHPDIALVLLDLALPGTRGLEMLGRLRRDFPRLPIAVLSATHDRATVESALAAGAQAASSRRRQARVSWSTPLRACSTGAPARARSCRDTQQRCRAPSCCTTCWDSRSGNRTCCACWCRASPTS